MLDQALRCPHVAAVLGWPEEIDRSTFRRLHRAAHQGGCIGLLGAQRRASARVLHGRTCNCWCHRAVRREAGGSTSGCCAAVDAGRRPRLIWRSTPTPATSLRRHPMQRVLAIWIPNWPVQRWIASRPERTGGGPAAPRAHSVSGDRCLAVVGGRGLFSSDRSFGSAHRHATGGSDESGPRPGRSGRRTIDATEGPTARVRSAGETARSRGRSPVVGEAGGVVPVLQPVCGA